MMMDNTFLKRLLHDEEGSKKNDEGQHKAYKDSEGYWTVGYGHLLEGEQSHEELDAMGLDDELDSWDGFTLTEQQASDLFDIDVQDAIDAMPSDFTDEYLETLGEHRRAVLISMCFQIGSINKFKSMLAAIREGDWERASNEMLYSNGLTKARRSAWYSQTPARCQRAADAMKLGYFEKYQETVAHEQEDTEESSEPKLKIQSQLDHIQDMLEKILDVLEVDKVSDKKKSPTSKSSRFQP